MRPIIVVPAAPLPEERQAIVTGLVAFNEQHAGPSRYRDVAVLIKDEADGKIIGGVWGKLSHDWLFIDLLFVPEPLRGQDLGTRVMEEAQALARRERCAGVYVTTFSFQARGFYEKLGFSVFGVLEDNPRGARKYFLMKRLA